MELERKYFKRWCDIISFRKYENFVERFDEEQEEIQYAIENDMSSLFWCLHCKYGVCEEEDHFR